MDKNEKESKKLLKKMNTEKTKTDKRAEKKKAKEENKKPFKEKMADGFRKFKDYCIKDTTRMVLLVIVLVAIYIAANLWVQSISLAQIDLTEGKLYTLTDQSKSIAQNVEKEITFYVWEYEESSSVVDLLKQYNAENEKIKYQIVSADDTELIQTYGFESGYAYIIGESEDGRISYIDDSDLYTYDSNYNVVDLTEQKLTNAINNLNSSETTKVYFLEGRTEYTVSEGVYYLSYYLENEYYEIDTIDVISDPTIPEDCDVLAIMGLSSDLTTAEADAICEYIENGGDMIITNDVDYTNTERNYTNFQRVLDEYGVSLPNKVVQEASSNSVSGYSNVVIQSEVNSDHEITRLMYNYSAKPILVASGIIEIDSDKVTEGNVTLTTILETSDEATLADLATETTESADGTPYTLGVAAQKTVESGEESRAVIFATTSSFSDNSIDGSYAMVQYNGDIILNSFAFAANKGELYSIRKTSEYTLYSVTEDQDRTVRMIITAIPVIIIAIGVIVVIKRRRLK